jgi:lipoprotein signal peptidase
MQRQLETLDRVTTSPDSQPLADVQQRLRRRLWLLGAVAGIALSDQGIKWWAWRHASEARINDGGDAFVPSSVGSMYAGRVTGGLLDLFDSGLLIVIVLLFTRRRRSTLVSISGYALIGGWSSNLLDRLALHYWTAPGSVRGVVDYLPIGQHYYNVADLFITSGTVLMTLGIGRSVLRRVRSTERSTNAALTPRRHQPRRVRSTVSAAAAVAVLTALVTVGVVNFGGATQPLT